MKKLKLITTLLAILIVLFGCKKVTPTGLTCSFVYSAWTPCSNNTQTRTYTTSPSGCTGTPPADSTQRGCVNPCVFYYQSWTPCSNNIQTRSYVSIPAGFLAPADSIQRPCIMQITIGNQTWTLKNLDVATYRNGDPIPEVQALSTWTNLTTGAWCYYENNTANGTTYGKLYNWYAVNDPRGLAPKGYHIPTDAEWTTLTSYLGGTLTAGGRMKEPGLSHWESPNYGATNTSGFTGLPGGYRHSNGNFYAISGFGCWWSSSAASFDYACARKLEKYNGYSTIQNFNRHSGLSVRCLRD